MRRLRSRLARREGEVGESLIEILMAIALLGASVIILMLGLINSIALASQRNGQATLQSAMRSISERIVALNITACDSTGTITTAIQALNTSSFGVTIGTPSYYSAALSGTSVSDTTQCASGVNTGVLVVKVPLTWYGLSATNSSTQFNSTLTVVSGP